MRIWIDTNSGTWGDASALSIVTVEDGAEEAMAIDTLESLSDSEISEWGLKFGAPLPT